MSKEANKLIAVGADIGSSSSVIAMRNESGDIVTTTISSQVIKGKPQSVEYDPTTATYKVGSEVLTVIESDDTEPTNNRDFHTSNASRVLHAHALRTAGVKGDIALLANLPPLLFYIGKDKNTALIEEKKANIKGSVIPCTTDAKPTPISLGYSIEQIAVYPESASAFIYARSVKPDLAKDGRYLCLDLGGFSFDMSLIDVENGRIDIVRSESAELGVITMLRQFAINAFGDSNSSRTLGLKQLRKAFDSGVAYGRDLTGIVEESKEEFRKQLVTAAQNFHDYTMTDGVLFTGGGARMFADLQRDLPLKSVAVTDEPESDNAKGQLLLIENVLGIVPKASPKKG